MAASERIQYTVVLRDWSNFNNPRALLYPNSTTERAAQSLTCLCTVQR